MNKFIEMVTGISNQWSMAAFAIAAILYVVLKKQSGKVHPIAWGGIVSIVIVGLVPILVPLVAKDPVYQVRVTVLDPQKIPVENARVWSSAGGEAKKVAGGWQFDIPSATKPADGKITVFADSPSAFLRGRQELGLSGDRHPSITIQLARDASATIRGIVVDDARRAISDARVAVVGYEAEAVVTGASGQFQLPAHAADRQQVRIHVEKAGYGAAIETHPAGDEPVTVVLDRKQ